MPKRFPVVLTGLPRPAKQVVMAVADIASLLFAVWAAYSLRLGEWFSPSPRQLLIVVAAPLVALPVFVRIGLYRSVIRYLGEQALWTIAAAMTVTTVIWTVVAFLSALTGVTGVPRSVPLLFWLIGTATVIATRFTARWLLWFPLRERFHGRQVLIYGAGEAGRQLAVSLRQGRELFPAGFVDEDVGLQNKDINGLRVYSPALLGKLVERFDIHDVIVTMPSAPASKRREVVTFLEQFPVTVRILPALTDIANGRHLVNMVREVDIGDLLGRDPVAPDPKLLRQCVSGRSVLVTGAGGSIGSELCRQIIALRPSRLVVLEQSEYSLYEIDRTIRPLADCEVISRLGSVTDPHLVASILRENGVETVYHAAAHKHVPLVEENVLEGIRNNIFGTLTLTRAAAAAGVNTFVLISTDKAVRPTNAMGMTKRWSELIVQSQAESLAKQGRFQRFCSVRFGNVLGSSGSVIPLFKEQIQQGGPVTVTHPDVTRYFMSIHEAVELVIQAGSLSLGGEVFLLDMGEPVKIHDLARKMIRLAGHSVRDEHYPEGDIEIAFTGLRPGEKLYEELLIGSANAQGTEHPKVLRAEEPRLGAETLEFALTELRRISDAGNETDARALLAKVALDPTRFSRGVRKDRLGAIRLA